jgi:prepilin-type N-terminal cleavage/methylation domain-containing protein
MKCPENRATPVDDVGRRSGDAGFTLVELMVSLFIVSLVGMFATTMQISSSRATRTESNRQVAAQLVTRELDAVRGLGGSQAQDLDPDSTTQINGLNLEVTRTVDTCWQVISADGKTPTCAATQAAGSAEMDHVVVTVSWVESGKTYTQSGDVTVNADPVFSS